MRIMKANKIIWFLVVAVLLMYLIIFIYIFNRK
jgi:hypothetical protein